MYLPSHFEESDPQALHALIRDYPLGLLVSHGEAGLDANHLPFELSPEKGAQGTLEAHVARNNPVWSELRDGDEVLVVFRAGDAYISPQWYPSKQEHHRQVPTWNYRVVHAHGRVRIRDDEGYVRGLVARLTRTHEATQETPWKMTDGPADYIDEMLRLIVGIEIEITRLVGKFKLSQNKEARDIRGASAALLARGEQAIGAAMDDCAARREG
ncbi:FMN-binding negative transcriptional regulator [Pseudomonas aeruginosa]|uniref:FMN-binding negative transcriptional regulator n=1 Tax=Pseudomonas aeruginosa TaxID=287 RepID=UPI002551E4B4|nr:FMN-binding negative transcriptional regulator [Pseudomonas aeruginosa]HBN8613821.1 FMN-binding negative transcriptional regulator [Pseudomonas aeruginosa]